MNRKKILREMASGNSATLPYTTEELVSFIAPTMAKALRRKKVDVVHRETCPVCGKRLVNLYRYNKEWLCRTCKITAEKIDAEVQDEI